MVLVIERTVVNRVIAALVDTVDYAVLLHDAVSLVVKTGVRTLIVLLLLHGLALPLAVECDGNLNLRILVVDNAACALHVTSVLTQIRHHLLVGRIDFFAQITEFDICHVRSILRLLI